MRLDYIDGLNGYGENVVRLYDFGMTESIAFRDALIEFVGNEKPYIKLTDLPFLEARNCHLALFKSDEDEGIISEDDENFFCVMTIDGYKRMIELIEPFCHKETKSYQFLYELDNLTDFLFSPAGTWDEED